MVKKIPGLRPVGHGPKKTCAHSFLSKTHIHLPSTIPGTLSNGTIGFSIAQTIFRKIETYRYLTLGTLGPISENLPRFAQELGPDVLCFFQIQLDELYSTVLLDFLYSKLFSGHSLSYRKSNYTSE